MSSYFSLLLNIFFFLLPRIVSAASVCEGGVSLKNLYTDTFVFSSFPLAIHIFIWVHTTLHIPFFTYYYCMWIIIVINTLRNCDRRRRCIHIRTHSFSPYRHRHHTPLVVMMHALFCVKAGGAFCDPVKSVGNIATWLHPFFSIFSVYSLFTPKKLTLLLFLLYSHIPFCSLWKRDDGIGDRMKNEGKRRNQEISSSSSAFTRRLLLPE